MLEWNIQVDYGMLGAGSKKESRLLSAVVWDAEKVLEIAVMAAQ